LFAVHASIVVRPSRAVKPCQDARDGSRISIRMVGVRKTLEAA
jgi:hypothetical protein